MLNFVKIGQSVAKILRFFDFSRWRPSAILDLFRGIFGQPTVSIWGPITLQNLVMIDAVDSIFGRLAGKWLFTPPKLGVL